MNVKCSVLWCVRFWRMYLSVCSGMIFHLTATPMLNCFMHSVALGICHYAHNFQRWMSWLEHRWRAQRSAISILNCRIPWTNRNLNAYCAFGISLKACLLQCLCLLIPANSYFTICCEYLCLMMCMRFMMRSWDIWRGCADHQLFWQGLWGCLMKQLCLYCVDLFNCTTWS